MSLKSDFVREFFNWSTLFKLFVGAFGHKFAAWRLAVRKAAKAEAARLKAEAEKIEAKAKEGFKKL